MKDCTHCGGSGREPDWKQTGSRVRAKREMCGIKLNQAAEIVGSSVQYLSELERGMKSWHGPKARKYLEMFMVTA